MPAMRLWEKVMKLMKNHKLAMWLICLLITIGANDNVAQEIVVVGNQSGNCQEDPDCEDDAPAD